jgi:hypothetical protein|tara:strand:+ start:69 stop:320 length:252 start_codon:yes stop_codon:yes gene_type:complete
MSRFGDLTGEKSTPEVAPVDTAPSSVEPVVEPIETVVDGDVVLDFSSMTKLELEEYGRTIGIELDRRRSKDILIEQLIEKLGE